MVFSKKIKTASDKALEMCKEIFVEIKKIEEYNQQKVLKSFIKNEISESHFVETTGYGYNDRGREKLDKVFADIFECEDALVRHNFVSGTHTLSTALFGILRPKDKVLCVTGIPYDTLSDVINSKGKNYGSLNDFDIDFEYIDYNKNEDIYFKNIKNKLLKNKYKLLYIQRSRGYTLRDSLSSKKIGDIIQFAKSIDDKIISMVDNCYGEFAEKHEPTHFGADLIAGSLIKNPGGGIAVSGGYIAGKKKFVEQCAYRLTAPGIGKEIGANFGVNRSLFMGILNAPHVVAEAKKTAVFAAALFDIFGYEVYPKYNETRCDIVQSIVLQKPELLINFCKGIQSASPIDSFVSPEPWDMPGYENKIIMAAGTFVSGSSIELSADGPLKSPYTVWVQGGTSFYCSKLGIMAAAEKVIDQN
ncbi:MAG: methionine gamma-lyase family protein [Clostridia bacterium]|nr:methionine gamma-lyase family protein [Clostridia bacterium]